MAYSFGDFELDEECRELRLRGQVIPLQPRVFDLMVVLYHNRHRVMGKDELLDTLWPNVIVGDGSLQRAVSLARAALKQGGLGDAIRNYARQGYRFCFESGEESGDPGTSNHHLQRARSSFETGEWDTAVEAFRGADAEAPLEAADLERLAEACQCSGRAGESEPVLERAAAAHAARGDCTGAARAALRLAEIAFESARPAVASGWLARGRRYLEGVTEGREHGFAEYLAARMAVAAGELEMAREHAEKALSIGQRAGSEDVESLGRVYLGFALLSLGRTDEGMGLLDEAAAAVLGGNISPPVGGVVYCGLIWVCCNRGDWERAAQWSESFSRWCERGGMTRFSGLCQLHRAEVISVSGEVADAESEIARAREQLSRYSPFAEGDAFRILGELRLMRGDLEGAETAFRRAHELGWEPQPGLAMLMAERGDSTAGVRSLARSLEDSNWALRQRRGLLLSAMVILAARGGDGERARGAMNELESNPGLWATAYHSAAVSRARAEMAALEGDTGKAVSNMREAIRSWQAARANLNLATCRFRLAELLAEEGDIPGALLEIDAARSSFEAADAPIRAKACEALRASLRAAGGDAA